MQERCLQRLGGKETIPVDVRVLAATHRDLEGAIRDKQFREDLYYRLSVVVIHLPPLARAQEDIPDLVKYFLRKYAAELGVADPSIHAEAVELPAAPKAGRATCANWRTSSAKSSSWPRITPSTWTTSAPPSTRAALPPEAAHQTLREQVDELLAAAQRGELTDAHDRLLKAAEREIFTRAIELAHGNQAKAARWLGISRLTMREKLHQFGLHPNHEQEKA